MVGGPVEREEEVRRTSPARDPGGRQSLADSLGAVPYEPLAYAGHGGERLGDHGAGRETDDLLDGDVDADSAALDFGVSVLAVAVFVLLGLGLIVSLFGDVT